MTINIAIIKVDWLENITHLSGPMELLYYTTQKIITYHTKTLIIGTPGEVVPSKALTKSKNLGSYLVTRDTG